MSLFRPTTIRAQILSAIGTIVFAAMVILVLVTLSVAKYQLYALGERDARDRVAAIAASAGFAAIVGADSPDIPKELLSESMGENGIQAMQLIGANGRDLASLQQGGEPLKACGFNTRTSDADTAIASRRVDTFWCISAPILQRANAGACTEARCVVGHLHVVAGTAAVDGIVRRLIMAILFMGSVLLAGALFVLWRVSSRISNPLRDIAGVMRRFAAGDRAARAQARGPDEVMTISQVYNELIEGQEHLSRNLEKTVEERTVQLKEATLAAQDAERYKTTFMAHISHDMRTPLHVIRSQASEVMNELEFAADPERARSHVDIIIRQSTELSFRVAQVLELTRAEMGYGHLDVGEVSVELLKASIADKAQALAAANHNQLTLSADSGTLRTDADKVLQILTNLIENACKFTVDGTVDVALRLENDEFTMTVTDSGVGIPADHLPHIWSEFRQAGFHDGRRIAGFGLGLAIVRQYVALLGGRYGARSEEGHGTEVWVTLPASQRPAPVVQPSAAKA